MMSISKRYRTLHLQGLTRSDKFTGRWWGGTHNLGWVRTTFAFFAMPRIVLA
jgi:hypothetical protein